MKTAGIEVCGIEHPGGGKHRQDTQDHNDHDQLNQRKAMLMPAELPTNPLRWMILNGHGGKTDVVCYILNSYSPKIILR